MDVNSTPSHAATACASRVVDATSALQHAAALKHEAPGNAGDGVTVTAPPGDDDTVPRGVGRSTAPKTATTITTATMPKPSSITTIGASTESAMYAPRAFIAWGGTWMWPCPSSPGAIGGAARSFGVKNRLNIFR